MRAKPLPAQPASKPVGIWVRVSTEDQAKGDSPEHHEYRARAYAESKGWRVREVYHLEGVSGKAVSQHPETQRMLAHVRSGHITGLIFSKLARLARNTRELLEFGDIFREEDADLISLQEAIDTSSPAGRLFFTIIAAMAQWEREEIAERVAASVPIRAKLGKPLAGAAPFGYRWENRQLVLDPQEAPIRKLMYELFREQSQKRTVARLLNERGYRTRNGSKFSDTTVDRLLRDPMAKGVRRANYTRSKGEGKAWEYKPESDWVLIPCPAIVAEELWTACNAALDANHKDGRKRRRPAVHLFTGLAFCHCGEKLYVPFQSPSYVCQKCRNKVRIDDLEAIFQEQLKGFLFSPEDLIRYAEQSDEVLQGKVEALQVLQAELEKVQAEMAKAYRLYQADQISVEGFGHLYRPLEERLKQLEEEVPRLQGEVDFLRIEELSRNEVWASAQSLSERWPDLTAQEKRQVVEAVVGRVNVGKNEVSIDLVELPSPSQVAVEKQRTLTPALHFCRWTLRGPKPLARGYTASPVSLGDHLKKRRMDLGITQKEAARRIGADQFTLINWEKGRTEPAVRFVPAVIGFLGCDPFQKGETSREQLRAARRRLGFTQHQLGELLGLSETTIYDAEHGRQRSACSAVKRIMQFLRVS